MNALRSGQYQKCKSELHDGEKYCVTGVLAAVYNSATGKYPDFLGGVVRSEVREWAGLSDSQVDWMMQLNDSNDGYGFKALANVIEREL